MNIGTVSSVNFNAGSVNFRIATKDGRALSEAVREYARTSSEEARMRAFNVYDKYMTKIAEAESNETGCLYEDYLQSLRLKFLIKLEDCKYMDKRISVAVTESMRNVSPTNEDKLLSDINDGYVSTYGNLSKYEAKVAKGIKNNIDEAESKKHLSDLMNDEKLFNRFQREILRLDYEGYSYKEIAENVALSPERVRVILNNLRLKLALENNTNDIQGELCGRLSSAFRKCGCPTDVNGRFTDVEKFLYRNGLYCKSCYLTKYLAEGETFGAVCQKEEISYTKLYDTVRLVLETLEQKENA